MAKLFGGLLRQLANRGRGYDPLKTNVALREDPQAPDRYDVDRIESMFGEYNRQTNALLTADRAIEYTIRMLCDQQWSFWNSDVGQYMDIADWFTPEEQLWRSLPTVNDELRAFVNTHARLTENPPIMTWVPGPDKLDADLAEVLDTLVKLDWRRSGMETLHPEIMMWMVVAGRGHAVTRLDPTVGEWEPWVAQVAVPLADGNLQPILGPDGRPMMSEQPVSNVPIGPDFQPRAVLAPNGQVVPTGKPHMVRCGAPAVDVYSPLQVRGEWGPQVWHKKRWHAVTRFLTPEQVWTYWGVEVEPDVNAEGSANVAILERVLYGAGFYGTLRNMTGGSGYSGGDVKGPLCTVMERWDAPLGFDERLMGTWAEPMMETPDNPGGRHFIGTPNTVISDGPREVRWPHTSPVRCFDYIRLPGRVRGLTSMDSLHSPQRFQNKMTQMLQDGAMLNGNPQRVVWKDRGIDPDDVDNAPNRVYEVDGDPTDGPPIAFLTPPAMSQDVYRVLDLSRSNLERLGGLKGTQGEAPTDDPSGELVKELRFNADRDLGDPSRRNAAEYARMAEDWRALYPLIYTLPRVIVAAGTENAQKTITVWPELFAEGNVNAQADAESMLPEGRGERQARAYRMLKDGIFGNPGDPEQWADATDAYLEMARFPNYSKMSRPGGPDRVTAEEENGELLMGAPGCPVLDWYNHIVHLRIHEKYMKSREFLKQPRNVQTAFVVHRILHIQALQRQMMNAQAAAGQMGGRAGGGAPGDDGAGGGAGESQPASDGPASQPASTGGARGRGPLGQSRPGTAE